MTYSAELFYPSQCELGEGPFCHADRLYWFDIVQSQLLSCNQHGQDFNVLQLPEMFSAGAVLSNDNFLLASETGLWEFSRHNQQLSKLHDLEADNPVTRSNDGRVDQHGGFWIGTMGKQCEPQAGALYRYYGGELLHIRTNLSIPNAICFSASGDYAFFTDSLEKIIYRWALDNNGWPIGEPQAWCDLSAQTFNPDGAIMDNQNYLWNAQWGASCVARYTPDAQLEQTIPLPVSQPSCPAIASDGKTIYITSAREGLTPEQLQATPLAGAVFRIALPTPITPEPTVKLP